MKPGYEALYSRLWQLVLDQDQRLEKDAGTLVATLLKTVRAEGMQVGPETQAALTEYLTNFQAQLRTGLESAIRLGSPNQMRDELVAALAQQAFTEQWPDGLNLSQRLWGFQRNFEGDFTSLLAQAAREGKSVDAVMYEMQRAVESQTSLFQIAHNDTEDWAMALRERWRGGITGPTARKHWNQQIADLTVQINELAETGTKHAALTALKKIIRAVESGNDAALDEAVAWWMYDKQLYLFKRIARSELANAQHGGVILSVWDDEDVLGLQWRLSSSHPEIDICDDLANIDMGLGKGVWTKEACPRRKPHPQCMCNLLPRVSHIRHQGAMSLDQLRAKYPKWAQGYHIA